MLKQRPKKDDHELTIATLRLADFREAPIQVRRADGAPGGDHEGLARLDAIISVVMGVHFPVGNAPWGELERAYGWLKELVEESEHAWAAGR